MFEHDVSIGASNSGACFVEPVQDIGLALYGL